MKRSFYSLLICLAASLARAEETNAVTNATDRAAAPSAESKSAVSFDAFKIITQRNIFDPNRTTPGRPRRSEDRPKPVRVDYLNLVGAMSYEKGSFAFFDGTSSEYRKSVKAGDSIAGYNVAEVTPNQVTLESDGKKVHLPVGAQLKRQDEGEWQLNSTPESFTSSGGGSPSSSSSTSGSETKSDSSSGEVNEVLKRLLEQRRQGK